MNDGMLLQWASVTASETYTRNLLARFGMTDCKKVGSPMDPAFRLSATMSPTTNEEKKKMEKIPYREAIGGLMYLGLTRQDILAAVNICARFASNPGEQHWTAVKRIFRYLQGTLDYGIRFVYDGDDSIVGYTDSDWAQDIDDRKSTSGFVFRFRGGTISAQSKKQKTVAMSSAEAEYMAACEAAKEALWWNSVCECIDFLPSQRPMKIYTDSKSAIALIAAPTVKPSLKHIDIRAHFIRDTASRGELVFDYLPTSDMPADILTKPLTPELTRRGCKMLGIDSVKVELDTSGSRERRGVDNTIV